MSVRVLGQRVSYSRLRAIVAGEASESLSRAHAVAYLVRTKPADAAELLSLALQDEGALSAIRVQAASGLARIATPPAIDALVVGAQSADRPTQAASIAALGGLGDKSVLEALANIRDHRQGVLAQHAGFAAALIAHRLGVEGHDLEGPADSAYLQLPHGAPTAVVARVPKAEAQECLVSLRDEPIRVDYAEHPVFRISCHLGAWIVLFNRTVLEAGAAIITERKVLLSVLARKRSDSSGYSVGGVVLTKPVGRQVIRVLVPRMTGRITWGGTGRVGSNGIDMQIRTVAGSGALAVQLNVTFNAHGISFGPVNFDSSLEKGREPGKSLGDNL